MFRKYEVFDPSALTELYDLQSEDDPNLVSDLLRDYLSQLGTNESSIVNSFTTGDAKSVERLAHSLKSSSRVLGLLRLGEICLALEDEGRSGFLKPDSLMSLRETISLSKTLLIEYLNKDMSYKTPAA